MSLRAALAMGLAALAFARAAHAGEIETGLRMESAALGRPLEFALYRPDRATKGLPVVYLLHGRASDPGEWLRMGNVRATADRLIAAELIPPMLIVLPDGGNSWWADTPPGNAGAVETAVADELPAAIERAYATNAARDGRAIAGNSMGGFGALRIAFGHPGRYAAVASMSGAFWTRIRPGMAVDDDLAQRLQRVFAGAFGTPFDVARFVAGSPLVRAAQVPPAERPPVFLTVSGGDRFRLAEEQDTVENSLRAMGYAVVSRTTPGDHDWGTWEAALPEVLVFLGKYLKAR
jgi:enterochelin esterase family protein